MQNYHIDKKRQMFWDDDILDAEKTTAFHRVLNPVKKAGI